MPAEEIPFDPTVAVAEDDVVEEDVDTGDLETTVPPPFSLRAMMKTFMTTQEAFEQHQDQLITKVAALRVDFFQYKSVFPPPPPSDP